MTSNFADVSSFFISRNLIGYSGLITKIDIIIERFLSHFVGLLIFFPTVYYLYLFDVFFKFSKFWSRDG